MDKRLCSDCLDNGIVTFIMQTYKRNGKLKNSIFKEMELHTSNNHAMVILDRYVVINDKNKPIPSN